MLNVTMATLTPPKTGAPTSGGAGGSGGSTINFKNNCFICLQPEEPLKMLEILQTNPKNLRTFQPVLHYLTGTDPTYGKSQEECRTKDLPVMQNLPPLCSKCYEITADIYRMHAELLELQILIQSKTEEARKVVAATRKCGGPRPGRSPKNSFLDRLEQSGMSKEQVVGMRGFVDKFHGRICSEGGKKVIFPSHPPPNFLPLAKPPTPLFLLQIPVQQFTQSQTFTSIPPAVITSTSGVGTSISGTPGAAITLSRDSVKTPILATSTGGQRTNVAPQILETGGNSRNPAPKILRGKYREKWVKVTPPPPPSKPFPIISKASSSSSGPPSGASITKSDVVMIPGKSAVIKFENEREEYEEEGEEEEEGTNENGGGDHFEDCKEEEELPLPILPEITIKEEPCDPIVFPDDDPHLQDGVESGSPSEESGSEYEMEENEEDDDEEEEFLPSKKAKRQGFKLKGRAPLAFKQVIRPQSPRNSAKTQEPQQDISIDIDMDEDMDSAPSSATSAPPMTSEVTPNAGSGRRKQVLSANNVRRPSRSSSSQNTEIEGQRDDSSNPQQPKLLEEVSCDICDSQLPPHQLKSHVRVHLRGKDGHFCHPCRQTFLSQSKLFQHWKLHPACAKSLSFHGTSISNQIRCTSSTSCSETFDMCSGSTSSGALAQFRDHIFTTHESDLSLEKVYRCALCPDRFRTEQGLDLHLNVHCHKNRRYRRHFDICPPGTTYNSNLHRPSDQKCDLCQFRNTPGILEKHFLSKHGLAPHKLIKCKICGYHLCSEVESYLEHLQVAHKENEDKPCYLCKEKFKKAYQVRIHLFQEHKVGELADCELCDKRFLEKRQLISHVREFHGEDKPGDLEKGLRCELCSDKITSYQSSSLLNQHISKCHSGFK